eukprot:CAMPEP_0182419634 /NCGR_PEP_ID=MMETSP1167-20130531/4041_1 /TAXON_ID=2988 /ORGANISM="Mallomonas Sp, Strain CCMP3275" /LENGTH=460 /DNA_ID=CAMNT_0024594651 /DNA_START=128 /DNA_END=1510 /DNA_ORIENTATION=+
MSHSDEESDDDMDEFEESQDERMQKNQNDRTIANKPYDEAYEVSQDLSMAESFDGRQPTGKEHRLKNDKYDEAVEVSQSMDPSASFVPSMKPSMLGENARSTSITNRPFDEALEFSHDDESSVDTRNSDRKGGVRQVAKLEAKGGGVPGPSPLTQSMGPGHQPTGGGGKQSLGAMTQQQQQKAQQAAQRDDDDEDDEDEESSSESGTEAESYENIEGAYNAKDYAQLAVSSEIKDLFQYIERFKPHEVELETTLKCFIPDYIPAIGEMDAFIKVPRPDGKDDELGLKILDEPAAQQSDPTVLELQLRASSKKQQYGDVAVKSIDTSEKGTTAIEKWITSISDLHRSKPPPQVHYRNNMPDIDTLMDVWPEEFEAVLDKIKLPSPDLDLSLREYSRLLCSMVDIPTYENPIESVHHFFTLYMAFRDNPHFQARRQEAGGMDMGGMQNYGGADVMEITQGLK